MMAKFLIPIDRVSIKANPNVSRNSYLVPGIAQEISPGHWVRDIQRVYSLQREPKWFFDYKNIEVECDNCRCRFPKDDLIDNSDYDYDGTSFGSCTTCPVCAEEDCCELEFEKNSGRSKGAEMKIRKGFVSNSSSSSFIVTAERNQPQVKIKLTLTADLDSMVDEVIETREELEQYILDQWSWKGMTLRQVLEDDEWAKEQYDQLLALIEQGKRIYICSCANDSSNPVSSALYEGGFENVEIKGGELARAED